MNYESIKNILRQIIKAEKIELFGGMNSSNSFMPGFKQEEWVELVGVSKLNDCEGGAGIIIKRKGRKTKVKCSVAWFKKLRLLK